MNDLNETRGVGVLGKVLGASSQGFPSGPSRPDPAISDCGRFDARLSFVLDQLHLIYRVDEMWDAAVASGRLGYEDSDEQELGGYYRQWLGLAEVVAVELEAHRASGCTFARTDEFLDRLEAVQGICTPDEVFFSGPALEGLRGRAVAAYHAGETVEIRDFCD